ncbi:MAG: efflux RND transporter periplasmic adaptor subunit [Chloroflexota bacterium]
MKTRNTDQKKKRFSTWLWTALGVVLLGAGAWAYFNLWLPRTQTASAETTTQTQTATVRQGNLVVSASGSGTLTAGRTAELAFPVSGTVGAVYVTVGQQVSEGEVLAELADLTALEAAMKSAEVSLLLAQQELETLKNSGEENLANARLAVAEAEKALQTAQASLKQSGQSRCSAETTTAYYDSYLKAKDRYEDLKAKGADYLTQVLPAKQSMDQAYANYKYCSGYYDYEITASQAEYIIAQANYENAKATLATLEANNGVDPVTLAQAESKVLNAQAAYEQTKKNYEGATLRAPFDGTVLSVAGEAGDTVSSGTFITLIDLLHPLIDFAVDETDVDKVAVGYPAEVVFDALPDLTFKGTVKQVSPSLLSEGGYKVVSGVIALDLSNTTLERPLMAGLNAAVDIIAARAENAVLVPVEALRDLGDGTFGVFVVDSDGKPRLRVVQVGIQDSTYAQILDGLSVGEVVTTGVVETK